MIRALIFIPAFLLTVTSALYAEDGQPYLFNLEFKQPALDQVDENKSPQDNEKIYRRNQRYLRDALQSYSKQTFHSIGLSDQTANFMGATIGFVTKGAKLNLNDSKTLAIEFKDVVTHDPALYFGYNLAW
jgi:hypothetical protein